MTYSVDVKYASHGRYDFASKIARALSRQAATEPRSGFRTIRVTIPIARKEAVRGRGSATARAASLRPAALASAPPPAPHCLKELQAKEPFSANPAPRPPKGGRGPDLRLRTPFAPTGRRPATALAARLPPLGRKAGRGPQPPAHPRIVKQAGLLLTRGRAKPGARFQNSFLMHLGFALLIDPGQAKPS